MFVKVLVFVLLLTPINFFAQGILDKNINSNQSQPSKDELATHLSAAETYQISGDLNNAAIENRAVVGIALQRIGNIEIEEGKYEDATEHLSKSKDYFDNAVNRINLAIAYLRQNKLDQALSEAKTAVELDPDYAYARFILGNIYYTKEDYQSALPELERVFILQPNFDAARALGLTYLHLKQLERAKLLHEEIQTALKKENAELHILFGQDFEQTNYPLEAEREFKRALAIDPKQKRASFFLGYVILQYGGSERLAEAGKAFEYELKLTPDDFYSNFFAGVVASSRNDHKQALVFLEKAAKLNSESSEVHLFLGQSQMEVGDVKTAEKTLKRSIELSVNIGKNGFESRRAHYMLGRLFISQGRREEGQSELKKASELQAKLISTTRNELNQLFSQVINNNKNLTNKSVVIQAEKKQESLVELPPERVAEINKIKAYLNDILAQGFYNLGVIDVQKNQPNSALENFSEAFQWKPDFPSLNRNWGIVSFRTGKYDQATKPLSRHLESNPNDILSRRMLGASYYFIGKFEQSIATLDPIKSVLINDPELAYFYGISLVQMKNFEQAKPFFDNLAGALQDKPDGLYYAAQGFMFLGDYERAVKEFSAVLKSSPNKVKANFFKGQSLIRLNNFGDAEIAFRKELELNPADESAKYHLALTLIERRIKNDEAISLLNEAIKLKADYADAFYQLGKIYIEKGETQKAIEELEKAVLYDDKKDYIHYQLSIAYRKVSRKEDAARSLKMYQKLKADNRKIEDLMPMGNP